MSKLKSFIVFYLLSFASFSQTSIFGDVSLHHDAQLSFYNSPVNFIKGNITSPEVNDAFVIFSSAQQQTANDSSYIGIPILSRMHTDFIFPSGDAEFYQPLTISNSDENDLMLHFRAVAYEDLSLSEDVDFISSRFHWLVSGENTAQVGLSWNTNSRLNEVDITLDELVILGHTDTGWEVIASQLGPFAADGITPTSLEQGMIFSEENISFIRYKAFTIGGVKRITTLLVSEGLTPNGDNVNDTWYIQNIERYPDAVIRVFNRWGGEVFYHQGTYQNDWNGTYKDKSKNLPASPYYYRIDIDNDGYVDHQGWIYINY